MNTNPTTAPSSPPDQTLRDRIAKALRGHWLCTVRDEADADGNLPCRCGAWREPGAEVDDENDWDSHLADAIMPVLHSLTLRELEQLARPNTPPSRPELRLPDHTVNEEEAPAPVRQRADCTELEWAEQERGRFERLYTRESVRADLAEQRADTAARDADIYQQRLERLGDGYTRERQRAEEAEAHRLALSEALGLGTGAPWDAIHDRATELGLPPLAEDPVAQRLGLVPPAADRGAVLTEAERTMLTYALDQAQEKIWSEDGFTDEDQAAVTSLRRLAAEAQQQETPVDRAAVLLEAATAAEQMRIDEQYVHHSQLCDAWDDGREAVVRLLRRRAAEAQQQCPGVETVPNRCTCDCEGCKHHCGAHNGAEAQQQPDTETDEVALLRLTVDAVEEGRRELRAEYVRLRSQLWTLAAVFEGFGRLLASSSRDWGQYAPDAWLYAVICGWDCEQPVHDETCTHGAMEEMAERHGWDAATVAKARRYRAVVHTLTAPAVPVQPAADGSGEEAQFGVPGCTCKPWTVEHGKRRFMEPGETVDRISGWHVLGTCPHHGGEEAQS